MNDIESFRIAVRALHRAKDAAYGNAWKRRGELLSVITNIARKVDRLEQSAQRASELPELSDERVLDTAVDLLVYTIKYMTLLADDDLAVARSLSLDVVPPYSDGPPGFESLWNGFDLSSIDVESVSIEEASLHVVQEFNELVQCFQGLVIACEPPERLRRASDLAIGAVSLIAAIRKSRPDEFHKFISTAESDDKRGS